MLLPLLEGPLGYVQLVSATSGLHKCPRMVPAETNNHTDQVPAPSAVFSTELPAQPKPQQGKKSDALEGFGVTGAGLCGHPHPFGCPYLRNTASPPLLESILSGGDGQGELWASLCALASG